MIAHTLKDMLKGGFMKRMAFTVILWVVILCGTMVFLGIAADPTGGMGKLSKKSTTRLQGGELTFEIFYNDEDGNKKRMVMKNQVSYDSVFREVRDGFCVSPAGRFTRNAGTCYPHPTAVRQIPK